MAISRRRLLTMPPKLHAFALRQGHGCMTHAAGQQGGAWSAAVRSRWPCGCGGSRGSGGPGASWPSHGHRAEDSPLTMPPMLNLTQPASYLDNAGKAVLPVRFQAPPYRHIVTRRRYPNSLRHPITPLRTPRSQNPTSTRGRPLRARARRRKWGPRWPRRGRWHRSGGNPRRFPLRPA